MVKLLLIGLGGFAGSVARYGVSVFAVRWGTGFPVGTLAVNVLGCLVVGGLVPFLEGTPPVPERTRLLVVTGFLGGFTTFSAFGLETQGLVHRGQPGLAALYVAASIGLGLAAVWAGKALIYALRGSNITTL